LNEKGASVDDLAVYMPRRDVEELLGAIRDRLARAAIRGESGALSIDVTFDRGLYSGSIYDPGADGRGRRAWGQPGHRR
jgi:hypothetical protein